MNKRQRKKQRRGEFQEFGFNLCFCTPENWSAEERDAFLSECIMKIESLGLAVGGGANVCWDVFVSGLKNRSTVSPAQRQALIDWLTDHPGVSAITAGHLIDAWYDESYFR